MARLVFGTGAHTYDIYPTFGELPAGWVWGNVSNVACDSQDRVYAFQRKDPPIVIFDSQGRYLDSWGNGEMLDAHGIFIGEEDNVYLLDRDAHELLKYTSDGKLLLRVGTRGRAHLQAPFNHPADVAVAPNGDMFIADGYGNSSVHRYSADGTYLFSWGISGEDEGEFSTPHGIWVDARSRVYVTDRENNCIQIFDAEGGYITAWPGVYHPMDMVGGQRRALLRDRPDLAGYGLRPGGADHLPLPSPRRRPRHLRRLARQPLPGGGMARHRQDGAEVGSGAGNIRVLI